MKELCDILPELSRKTVQNVFWDYASLEPPMVFLSDEKWPDDTWETVENDTKVHLTMYVDPVIRLFSRIY